MYSSPIQLNTTICPTITVGNQSRRTIKLSCLVYVIVEVVNTDTYDFELTVRCLMYRYFLFYLIHRSIITITNNKSIGVNGWTEQIKQECCNHAWDIGYTTIYDEKPDISSSYREYNRRSHKMRVYDKTVCYTDGSPMLLRVSAWQIPSLGVDVNQRKLSHDSLPWNLWKEVYSAMKIIIDDTKKRLEINFEKITKPEKSKSDPTPDYPIKITIEADESFLYL